MNTLTTKKLLILSFWLALGLHAPGAAGATRWDSVLLTELGLFHYAPKSVSQKDSYSVVQTLLDYKVVQRNAQGSRYLSSQAELQINCKSRSARIMHTTYFSEAMGAGKEVFKEGSVRDWMDIAKGSPIERIAHRIC